MSNNKIVVPVKLAHQICYFFYADTQMTGPLSKQPKNKTFNTPSIPSLAGTLSEHLKNNTIPVPTLQKGRTSDSSAGMHKQHTLYFTYYSIAYMFSLNYKGKRICNFLAISLISQTLRKLTIHLGN